MATRMKFALLYAALKGYLPCASHDRRVGRRYVILGSRPYLGQKLEALVSLY